MGGTNRVDPVVPGPVPDGLAPAAIEQLFDGAADPLAPVSPPTSPAEDEEADDA